MKFVGVHLKESCVTSASISVVWGALRPFAGLADVINLAAGYERVQSYLLVSFSVHSYDTKAFGSRLLTLLTCRLTGLFGMLQPGSNDGQLGALRVVQFGEHRLIEQLTAFDEEDNYM